MLYADVCAESRPPVLQNLKLVGTQLPQNLKLVVLNELEHQDAHNTVQVIRSSTTALLPLLALPPGCA